jgi:hypothetical protein
MVGDYYQAEYFPARQVTRTVKRIRPNQPQLDPMFAIRGWQEVHPNGLQIIIIAVNIGCHRYNKIRSHCPHSDWIIPQK